MLFVTALMISVSGISLTYALADGLSRQESARIKAYHLMSIAEEQMKRGLNKEAEISLLEIKEIDSEYLTAEDIAKVDELLKRSRGGMTERQSVLNVLAESDDLVSAGQYAKAKALLEGVKDSDALSSAERKEVANKIKGIDRDLKENQYEMTKLFDSSVKLYQAGNLDKAREGFSTVARSGLGLTVKGKTAQEYISMVDKALASGKSDALVDMVEDAKVPDPAGESEEGIGGSIKEMGAKFALYKKQVQQLLDESLDLFNSGDFKQARAGFSEVSLSGIKVVAADGKTADEYIELIDSAETMQAEAAEAVKVASGQYQKGLYEEAQTTLLNTQTEYSVYLTSDQKKELGAYIERTRVAIAGRLEIAEHLKASDQFLAEKNYGQARVELEKAVSSQFISDEERNAVIASIEELDDQVKSDKAFADRTRIEDLFANSVDLYIAGNYDAAKAGFEEVAASGVDVSLNNLNAGDYLTMIEKGVKAEDVVKPEYAIDVNVAGAARDSVEPGKRGYIDVIQQKRNIQISYTETVVADSAAKAMAFLAVNDFASAKQSVGKALSVVNKNKLLLGDALYREYEGKLALLNDEILSAESKNVAEKNQQAIDDATETAKEIRDRVESQRKKAVEDGLANAYTSQQQQRYEEALGQLEQVLAIDPHNDRALREKSYLEDNVRWREQAENQKESDDQEIRVLLDSERASIPYSNEITHPKNWKDLVARREKDEMEGRDEADVEVYNKLDEKVDLSELTTDTTLGDAINILSNSVEPPLSITVLWSDLSNNAFINETDSIGISGERLSSIPLRTGLERVLQGAGGGLAELDYAVEGGAITVATKDSLPETYEQRIYDVSELSSAPFEDYSSGGYGGGGGGSQYGGGGGSSSFGGGGSGGGSSFGGGGSSFGGGGSSFGGGGSSFGGGGGGSQYGGGGGGSQYGGGGGRGGNRGSDSYSRIYELIYNIQQIEPDSWDTTNNRTGGAGGGIQQGGIGGTTSTTTGTGEGRVRPFGTSRLVVWQTPEIHEMITVFLEQMKDIIDNQVAIEARFILVDENWLENIGVDVDFTKVPAPTGATFGLDIDDEGQRIGTQVSQNSYDHVAPAATAISSSLGGLAGSALTTGMTYIVDDLEVDFLIRATQAHSNAKTLTAPKVTVLSGEPANISVTKQRNYISSASVETTAVAAGDNLTRDIDQVNVDIAQLDTGIQMNVTPVITSDKKYVILRISAILNDELDNAGGTIPGVIDGVARDIDFELPLTETTNIQTRVTVPDMGTVLLGGLTLTAEKDIESGVPGLSKMPLIGRLFSNRSEVKDKQILLILVRPTIILKDEKEEDAIAAME